MPIAELGLRPDLKRRLQEAGVISVFDVSGDRRGVYAISESQTEGRTLLSACLELAGPPIDAAYERWRGHGAPRHGEVDESIFDRAVERHSRPGIRASPPIVRADPVERIDLGAYTATLFANVEAEGPIQYVWLMAFEEARELVLLVAAEVADAHDECFLGMFDGQRHRNFGADKDWRALDHFRPEALRMAAGELGSAL